MRKTILFISLLFSISILGCNGTIQSSVESNGNTIKKDFSVSEFSAINASHAFDITISVGNETSVSVETDENILKYVKVYVKNNTLYLDVENNINIHDDMKVNISTPNLNSVDLSGACKINIDGIDTDSFLIDMSGACNGTFSGNTNKLDIELSGATKLNSVDLKAKNVKVEVSGASKCNVYSSNSISAEASGASKIKVFGDPPGVKTDVSGASSINFN